MDAKREVRPSRLRRLQGREILLDDACLHRENRQHAPIAWPQEDSVRGGEIGDRDGVIDRRENTLIALKNAAIAAGRHATESY